MWAIVAVPVVVVNFYLVRAGSILSDKPDRPAGHSGPLLPVWFIWSVWSVGLLLVYFWVEGEKSSMPIYEYACQKCGHQIEVMQKMSDAPLTKCPACKGASRKAVLPDQLSAEGSGMVRERLRQRAASLQRKSRR
jgi:putative FmdB family regulatory protein